MTRYRKLLHDAFAKLGEKNKTQLLSYYDTMAGKLGEHEAISLMHEAFVQLRDSASSTASTNYKSLLSQTAQSIWSALDGKTMPARQKHETLEKIKELEIEIGGKLPLGIFEVKEVLTEKGMLERHRIYRAAASEQADFEIEVRI